MSYAANRHHGVRAAVVWSPVVAHLAREHNDANVLVLPARCLDQEESVAILKEWLNTPFAGGRHARRVAQIEETGPDAPITMHPCARPIRPSPAWSIRSHGSVTDSS